MNAGFPTGSRIRAALRADGTISSLLAIVIVGMAFCLARQVVGHGDYLLDLRAFYCGGNAVFHHLDPYATRLDACENAIVRGKELMGEPHPPFAVALYAIPAALPWKTFALLYIVCAWLATGLTAIVLSRVIAVPAGIVALGIAPLLGYYCSSLGQPTPFIALALVTAAYLVARERDAAGGAVAALTLMYPQLGLPVAAAMFACLPRARLGLVAAAAGLGLLGLLVLGPAAHLHYVVDSLWSEQEKAALDGGQYSVSWLLEQLGVPVATASTVTTAFYAIVTLAGIAWLWRYARGAAMRPLIVLLPPALICLSCSYVHLQHVALALPFVFFCVALAGSDGWSPWCACALAVVPWKSFVTESSWHDVPRSLVFLALALVFVALFARERRSPFAERSRLGGIAAMYALVFGAIFLALDRHHTGSGADPNTLATLAFKIPSLLAIALAIAHVVASATSVPKRA